MKRTAMALLVALLVVACGGNDNASPMTHGAGNKPSDVTSGQTKSNTPSPGNPDAPPRTPGAEGTYGESGATPGGTQTTRP